MANKELNVEKLKALQLTMEKLDKTFGKGSVMKLGDSPVEKEQRYHFYSKVLFLGFLKGFLHFIS